MDSKPWKLDFSMEILLTHALKSEAGLIKQFYPGAKPILNDHGQELVQLNDQLSLLRTGIGLERTEHAMATHVNPEKFDLIIHFGVSGSLHDKLGVMDIIRSTRYSRPEHADIWVDAPGLFADLGLSEARFLSTLTAITDEPAREMAKTCGAEAVDMESYAVATFCQAFDIPLLAIRCISDRAGASTPGDFKENYAQASKKLQKFLLDNILRDLH